jgi:TatD DNase family protein
MNESLKSLDAPAMFDAHCHLQDTAFDADRDAVIAESELAGVSHFLVPATDSASFEPALNLMQTHEHIYCGLGIHPHSADEWNSGIRELIQHAVETHPKIVAIGEIGLDYHYDFSPREVQRKAFSEQIELAIELQKPIVIHTRESEEDVFRIVEEHYASLPAEAPRGQFHCFSAGMDRMQQAISLGFHVSFTGNITFKNSNLMDVVKETPLDRLLIETDSPYLTPAPNRGKRNSPAMLPFIAHKVSELKQEDISIIMRQTFANAHSLFRISPGSIRRSIALLICAFGLLIGATNAFAQQPAGVAPPDSVLTSERRKAEELRIKQEAELAKEAEQRRQDSIKSAQNEQLDAQAKAREQIREDSVRVAQQIADQARQAAFLETPEPWRAVGIGFSGGVGSMQTNLGIPELPATSVFSYGIALTTELTRRLDLEISFVHFTISDNFPNDSVFNYVNGQGPPTPPSYPYRPFDTSATHPSEYHPNGATHLLQSETLGTSIFGLDLHYDITRPASAIKFYLGIGYEYLAFRSSQQYLTMLSPTQASSNVSTFEQDWNRSGLKLLFGMKHEFELGSGYTLEPFAQIGATGVFGGEQQDKAFVFQPGQPIITVNVDAGISLYYGWWGVPRQ